jgi:AcrR family transcriptional regulator
MSSTWERRLADQRAAIRLQIVAAARQLVVARGMPNVSMSAVADAAGVSRQTLYNHFSNLEDVILAGVDTAIDDAALRIATAVDAAPDPPAALEIFVQGSVAAMAHDELAVGGGGMSHEAETRALELLERFHAQLNRILHQGVDTGHFRADLAPDQTSEVLFHMIGATRMLVAHGRDPEQVAARAADLVLAAVRA